MQTTNEIQDNTPPPPQTKPGFWQRYTYGTYIAWALLAYVIVATVMFLVGRPI